MLVDEAEATARRILTDNLDQLHLLAKALLEYETLSGEEIKALLRGETITRKEDEPPSSDRGTRGWLRGTRGQPWRWG